MNKINKTLKLAFVLIAFSFIGCEKEEYKLGTINAPSGVSITAEIVGADADNPNGNGTGVVHFNAVGSDVITWKFVHNGVERMVPSGKATYAFSTIGLHTYTVSAVAIGAGGSTSDVATNVEVLATYEPPADLIAKLTEGTWRVPIPDGGHMGVGPTDGTTGVWWTAGPGDKSTTGMKDDTYTFNADGTFTFNVGADFEIFGKGYALETDFGGLRDQSPDGNNDVENFPVTQEDVDNLSGTWYITAPGGKETINLSGLGFIGFYHQAHAYEILDRSVGNEMKLKSIYAYENNAWFWTITNKE